VCRRNTRRLQVQKRVRVLKSDLFAALGTERYDIIVSNPPYVGSADMRRLPREYRHEPALGLRAGTDGLDSVRIILSAARRHLADDGILVVEVGNSERALKRAFPRVPFIWPDISMGGGGVFVLRAEDLPAAGRREK
jgi:ribosomal protein L3 glutamine methyltransferase